MKRALALTFSVCALGIGMSGGARAEWAVGAGFENFRWKETTTPEVKESGLRFSLDLTWIQSREAGLSAEYNIKAYTGNVDYTGAFIGSGLPISGEVHYRGLANEVRSVYRMPVSAFDVVLAAGWDHWNRKISVAQQETYDALYARLGGNFNSGVKQGPFASAGMKYPFYVRENAHLTDLGFNENPRIRPRPDFSFYGTIGYRVNAAWDVMAFYDSFRFKQSNTVVVSTPTTLTQVFQPKSREDIVGLKIQRNF